MQEYRVWYRPYGCGPDEEDYIGGSFESEEDARRFGNSFGWVTEIEVVSAEILRRMAR